MASNSANDCSLVDNTFGPWAGPDCRGGFDFTLLFEESILSILPLAVILSCAFFRIPFLWRRANKVRPSKLLFIKLVLFLLPDQTMLKVC